MDSFEKQLDEDLSSSCIFFVMLFSMLIYKLPWFSNGGSCGNKTYEIKRDRKSFEEEIDIKLSEYLFRRIYRMTRVSFHVLHTLLEPKLLKMFFPLDGGSRKYGENSYLIDTKTRLSIAICYFTGSSATDLMRIHNVGLASVYV